MKKINLFHGYHYPMSEYTRIRNEGGFVQLSLDVTSRCNYRCGWCFNGHLLGNDSPDKLDISQTTLLLDQARYIGAKTLVLPGTGEPTLDKNFDAIINHANKLEFTTVVYTNLTGKVDEEIIRKMFASNVSIGIKYDSLRPEHFVERYHASKSSHTLFLRNLELVSKIYSNTQYGTNEGTVHRCILNTVLTSENMSELDSLTMKSAELGFPMFIRPVKPVKWALDTPELWQELGEPNGQLQAIAAQKNMLFSPSATTENHCAIYSFGLTVKNNGDVQVCPDHHESRGSFGNVKNTHLKEIIKALNKHRIIKPGYCVMLPDISHKKPG